MIYATLDARFTIDDLGYIPGFLNEEDPDDARTQLDKNYQHGGGFRPQPGWTMIDHITPVIQYPGDPAMRPLAGTVLHGTERILFFPYAYVMIWQEDGSFCVARMD